MLTGHCWCSISPVAWSVGLTVAAITTWLVLLGPHPQALPLYLCHRSYNQPVPQLLSLTTGYVINTSQYLYTPSSLSLHTLALYIYTSTWLLDGEMIALDNI